MRGNFFLPSPHQLSNAMDEIPPKDDKPAEEGAIDLNEQLVKNRSSTFFMRVNSEVMAGAGIHCGDVLIVDRALEAKNGKIIIAVIGGELLIRRLEIHNNRKLLVPATHHLSTIDTHNAEQFSIWGVVTYVIHCV